MLTIKSPITLTCSPIMTRNYDAFEERMKANYQLMQANLEPTDFLHLVSAPPEVYLGDNGMTQLIENTAINNVQDIKFDLINNMINRIVLMEEGTLTYQDQVFISSMLRKIGVNNVEEFINQVKVLKNEAVNKEELINLYWNHSEELREISEIYQSEQAKAEVKSGDEEKAGETVVNLHQEILDRLQTAAIYQEVRNFNTDFRRQDSYISREELRISEQSMLTQNMLLTELQNIAYIEEAPLVFEHINAYEYADDEEELMSTERITNKLVEATLLNTVDRIITTRLPQVINKNETWYSVSNFMHEFAGDTIERFKHNHSQTSYNTNVIAKYTEEVNSNLTNEIANVKNIVTNISEYRNTVNKTNNVEAVTMNYREEEYTDASTDIDEETVNINNQLNRINRQNTELQQRITNVLEKEILAPGRRPETAGRVGETDNKQTVPGESRVELNYSSINNIDNEESVTNNYMTEENIDNSAKLDETIRIQNELNRINKQNIIMQQKALKVLEKEVIAPKRTANRQRTRQEALKALENPEEAVLEFHQTVDQSETTLSDISQEFYDILSPETREIFQILADYRKNPEKVIASGLVNKDADVQLLTDIVKQEQTVNRENRTEITTENQQFVYNNELIENETTLHDEELLVQREHDFRSETFEHVVEQVRRSPEVQKITQATTDVTRAIEFVHKSEEHSIDEEVLEEIINQTRTRQQNITDVNQVDQIEHVHETHTQTVNVQQINTQADEIARMVQQGVQSQIGNLSDQVYQRLERRLSNERMRRGR